ncbi:MAG: hypothetical protein QXU12_06195 [Nitrososphaerota archaeon]
MPGQLILRVNRLPAVGAIKDATLKKELSQFVKISLDIDRAFLHAGDHAASL